MIASLEARLLRAASVLEGWRDVLEERVADGAAPGWAVRRGWDGFLLGLGEDQLAGCERGGAASVASLGGAPRDLVELAREVAAVVGPSGGVAAGGAGGGAAGGAGGAGAGPPELLEGASRRKSGQVAAVVELCRERGLSPRRVLDVGAGVGHLTRALAKALGVEAVGLERDAERVERARARSAGEPGARFEAARVASSSLEVAAGDLLVGLHACGALGDALVEAAARGRVDVVLVACCPQKISGGERRALSRTGRDGALTIARRVLGLANAFDGLPDLEARAVRGALRWILRARGVSFRPGEETEGLTPRIRRKLGPAADRALARRGLAASSEAEQREALGFARAELGSARRRTLPRRLLASALEVALALDRARALEESGAGAEVVRLFPRELSPRNLAVIARAP